MKIDNYTSYWENIVLPDMDAFSNSVHDLRLAFHLAISLFHTSDWVYCDNKTDIHKKFLFLDKAGVSHSVSNEKQFADSIRDMHPDFELIRGIANAAKHLELRSRSNHSHSPIHAANTVSQSTGWGQGNWGQGPYGGTQRVMLQGPNGQDLEFLDLANSVHDNWVNLAKVHNWKLK